MKILIITGIFPPDIGGPATYVPVIAAALTERGHRVCVITLSDVSVEDDGQRPYPVVRIKRSLWRPVRMALSMAVICRYGITADVLFVNGLALEAALINLLLRKPLVQKVVGDLAWERCRTSGKVVDDLERFQTKKYSARVELLKKLRSWWAYSSTAVIAPSRYLKRIVAGWGVPEDKITVIYNAINQHDHTAPPPAQIRCLPARVRKIVSIGRLVPWKGFEELITVCSGIPDVHLYIIGDGPHRKSLQRHISALQADGRVHLLGACTRDEVGSFLRHADLFVLNSRYEGLPHIVLEAMGAGVPVIATDAGGTAELVQDRLNGLLINPGDTTMLAQAVRELLDNGNLRASLIENGYKTVERFTFRTLLDQTEALLISVVQGTHDRLLRSNRESRIPVLFLSTARFTTPPDATTVKKWSGLEKIFNSTVLSVHDGTGFLRERLEGADWILMPARRLRFFTYLLYMICAAWESIKGTVTGKYQAIIAQSPFQALAPAIVLLPFRFFRVKKCPKLIVEIHNDWTEGVMLYHPGPFSRIEKSCRLLFGGFALRQADAYRVISDYCRSLLPISQKPVFVFPTFTDLEAFAEPSEECIEKMRQRYGTGFFITAGMLIELKGIHHLIKAFADLLPRHPEARLLIAGKGRDEQKFRHLARSLGVEQKVEFVGHFEQSDLAGLVKNSLAFILSSLTEGLGRVVIEAQLLGKPVIATRVGGIPEIVEDGITGILIPPGDVKALSQAMEGFLKDPGTAERMGTAGRQRLKEKFDYSGYFQAYHDMVRKVCGSAIK